jgi:hypothetical protein
LHKDNLLPRDVYEHQTRIEIPKEVYAMLNLAHPRIISLVDYFDEAEYFVIITELFGRLIPQEGTLL